MKRGRRIAAAIAVAVLCAPGTFLRSEVANVLVQSVEIEKVAGAASTAAPGWEVNGVWQYRGKGRYFGGFSALLVLPDQALAAYSDRGVAFTLSRPDTDRPLGDKPLAFVRVAEGRGFDFWDIESATRDPATGNIWLGYEYRHAIHRFTPSGEADGLRDLEGEVDWYVNGGLEAMVRLTDGRFLALPERGDQGLIYSRDPVDGGEAVVFDFVNPAPGFAATDLAQLPDGRVLVLMRALSFGSPPFASLIAIGDPPDEAQTGRWSPQVALRLDGVIPAENYEGIAVEPLEDGRVAVWVLSDDNFSILQRTLLARLVFDPKTEGGK